ncbi:MAG: hypothetical protein Q8K24_11220 [Hydrogenophaga sp.]|nr:hypothetical protein [Hydrogenophaga sp.]
MDHATTPRRTAVQVDPGAADNAPVPGAFAAGLVPLSHRLVRWTRLLTVSVAVALVAACGGGSVDEAGVAGSFESRAAAGGIAPQSLQLKVLVISAEGVASRPSYLAITSVLDQIGVPHDRIVLKGANATALQLAPGTLHDGAGNGKYQGIILETGDLAYEQRPGYFPSAMTASQWAMLRQYQTDFGVRSATMYTRPAVTVTDDGIYPLDVAYGLTSAGAVVATDARPITATFTASGRDVFSYLNSASPILFKTGNGTNLFTYPSTPVSSASVVPLLLTTDGVNSMASVYTAPEGWQNLTLSADGNPDLTHSLLLGYGVVNWVTKGVFLGERKVYMTAQPDDIMIPDELWDPVSKSTPGGTFRHRNTATDYNRLVAWQAGFRSDPLMSAFRLEMPFNGVGYNTTNPEYLNPGETVDTLSPAIRANPNAFRWINHTWDHTKLDPKDDFTPTVASITSQLAWNHQLAIGERSGEPNDVLAPKVVFGLYERNAFIQPEISGLESPVFWEAAQNFGLRYILMDTSKAYSNFIPARTTVDDIPPNTGYTSSMDTFVPGNPRIFIIPRYPTNLYYNVSTPAEWVSEYNHFYGTNGIVPPPPGQASWFGGDSTYEQILDRESEVLLRYMLKFHANSWMFHAANLRTYQSNSNRSTLSDLLDLVAAKYRSMYQLPVLSPSQTEIGRIMQARMAYNAAVAGGLNARLVYGATGNKFEIQNPSGVSVAVPVTGLSAHGTVYGGQTVASIALAPGQSLLLDENAPAHADLSMAALASTTTPAPGGTVTFQLVMSNVGPGAVSGAGFSSSLPAGMGTITQVTSTLTGGAGTSSFSSSASGLAGRVDLPAGARATVTFRASVSIQAGGTLTQVSSITAPSGVLDTNLANNFATLTLAVPTPDVATSLQLPAGAAAGSVIQGTVTFSNIATGTTAFTATAVTGSVNLSNGTVRQFAVGSLAPGARSVQTFTTTVPTLSTVAVLNGTSTVATVGADRNLANNTATASMLVQRADVLTKVSLPTSAWRMTWVTGYVTFTNGATGPSAHAAAAVTGKVTLSNGNSFSYSLGTLAPGASVTRSFLFLAPYSPGTLTATSQVATTTVESNTANNTSKTSMQIR